MIDVLEWRDHEASAVAFIYLDRGYYLLSVHEPNQYSEVWTAQAELINEEYRQVKFSGLFNGGGTRESAKAAAPIALERVTK